MPLFNTEAYFKMNRYENYPTHLATNQRFHNFNKQLFAAGYCKARRQDSIQNRYLL